ncbi:MAG: NERD domain-containing protein [Actinobacteria bacterium]|nr:NERD domain-containing protein [Actinomycetota bacterium]
MPPFVHPEHPQFADDSERVAWEALKAGLRDDDVLLHGVRFTDPRDGDVEIDLLVLMPDAGAVVIEVKGGHVTYSNGSFQQTGADGTHPIDPLNQAMKGMYALKRFLESRPHWSRGKVRATWMACFPYTEVTHDMGPQGRRDVLIGKSDVPQIVQLAWNRLWDPALTLAAPRTPWVDAVLEHLLGTWDQPGEIAARSAARLQHVDQLTETQARVLGLIAQNRRFEITGSAGTGKTWLAMEQARRWSEAGERVCFVSYGRGVASSVSHAMAELPARSQPAFIGTFHQLGWTWGVMAGPDAGSQFWETDAPQRMLEAARGLADDQRFTAFVVDEAQDFADSWWPALLASAASDDYRLAVMRDDEQAVFTQRRGRPEVPLVPVTLNEHIALLTTQHRHPVQVESSDDKAAYWEDFWGNDVFYSTVAGFKGLERPVVVLAIDGFHEGVDPRSVLYAGMSRARDLLIVVGDSAELEAVVGGKLMRRLQRGAVVLPPTD